MPYVESEGARIYWEEHGGGDPLLLVMGLGYSSDMWYRAVPALSRRHRTILFDNRGVGRSSAPRGPYSISSMAGDAAAVLDAAGVESSNVYGISMGGMIAQELTLRHPHRVRSLILACTSCGGLEAVPASLEVIGVLYARANMTPTDAFWAMARFVYDPSTPRERIEEDLAVRVRTFPPAESYMAQLQGVLAWHSYTRLHEIKAPTLIIHGESDRLVPPENGAILARAIEGARLVPVPNASHILLTDQPAFCNEAVLSFLEEAK
ncbi:MAG TPA: alpha/beta fold hydrolase [Blastocatellia bacterium]|jgi:pimeloyl-ACP methyl ester carboxylesterase|nr:alpha/beta fold hydrolase [Blastocatellia bacterium]